MLKFGQATADFLKAIELDSSDYRAHYGLAICHGMDDKPREAIGEFTKSIDILPSFATAYCLRGLTYELLGETANANSDFSRTKALQPDFDLEQIKKGAVDLDLFGPND